jgi:hypothetical protein
LERAIEQRSLPSSDGWLPVPPAEPVMAWVRQFAAMEPCASGSNAAQRLPALAGVEPVMDSAFEQGQVECALPPARAIPSRLAAGPAPAPPAVAISLPGPTRMTVPAGLSSAEPVRPRNSSRPVPSPRFCAGAPSPVPAAPLPAPALPPLEMAPAAERPPAEIYPVAGFIALEYYSQRTRGSALLELRSIPGPRLPVQLPPMRLEPLAVRPGDLAPLNPAKKPPAKVIAMPARAKPVARAGARWHTAGAIAAGVFIGLFAWSGASLLRIGITSSPVKPGLFAPAVSLDASNPPAPSSPAVADARAPAAKGPAAWVRNAVAKRATVEFSDTFRNGMSAWGERPSTWAPGWSRNPDGYVRPGQLALFGPSLAYSNYHMDFFTQIESKSVGWVVRARDRKNYYAMKFRVVEPGLRPIIAMVHVTVLGGKPGREMEIPLSVMVHNNEPYHVAVEVKGNRMVTSIEGQEIDSFTDDTLTSGGVGFFADAGEKARLYWMRVTANDDFVGRVCAYVATALGQASPAAAWLQPGEAPMGAPGPREPGAEIALGAALGFRKNRMREPWA